MFRPIDREEYVKKVSDRYDNETAMRIINKLNNGKVNHDEFIKVGSKIYGEAAKPIYEAFYRVVNEMNKKDEIIDDDGQYKFNLDNDFEDISDNHFDNYVNPENCHNFCKGLKIKNLRAANPNKVFTIIGLYKDNKPESSNYGKFSFAVKEDGGTSHSTSFWFPLNGGINPNIVFMNPEFNRFYNSSKFLESFNRVKRYF